MYRRQHSSNHPSYPNTCSILPFYFYFFFFFCPFLLSIQSTTAQFIQTGLCDRYCQCPTGEAVVDCNRQDKLRGVPTNIPRGVNKLYIQDGDFSAPSYLTRANMTDLEDLEHLRIIYCNLQAIESKTFLSMTKLRHLDLSHNSLRRLDPYTFFGLQLINLYLQEQHNLADGGLFLTEDTFDGLTADQVNLRENKLSSIEYRTFSKVNNLHRLILSNNRITKVDDGFSNHFNGPSYMLDLTGNPLECSCNLAWIAALSAQWANSLPGVNMTCLYQGPKVERRKPLVVELRRLTPDHLCPRSRIQYIEVNILDLAMRALLDCTAVSMPQAPYSTASFHENVLIPSILTRTPPEVMWQYVEDGQSREVKWLSSDPDQLTSGSYSTSRGQYNTASSTVRLNVSLQTEPRQYKCTTKSQHHEIEQVVVTLRGPTSIIRTAIQTPVTTEKFRETAQDLEQIKGAVLSPEDLMSSEPHYLRPQFSLAQLVLAVIGTFFVTLIFLFIGSRIISVCNSHKRFRLTSSASSITAADGKVAYQPGTVQRGQVSLNGCKPIGPQFFKQNGLYPIDGELEQVSLPYVPSSPAYPTTVMFSGAENQLLLSPLFSHTVNPYLQQQHALLSQHHQLNQSSLSSGNDGIQPQNMVSLVSPPIMRPVLPSMMDSTLSPCLRPGSTVPYQSWPPITPGSPQSATGGNHVYDLPGSLTPTPTAPGPPLNSMSPIGGLMHNMNDSRGVSSTLQPFLH